MKTDLVIAYPHRTIWYVEAMFEDGSKSQGSAVAIQLQPTAQPARAKTYLLTCAHVIRGRAADKKHGYGRLSKRIRVWPPGANFGDAEARAADVNHELRLLSPDEIPVADRSKAEDDWAILNIDNSPLRPVEKWCDSEPSTGIRIYGYAGGADSFPKSKQVLPMTSNEAFHLHYAESGVLTLSGSGTRPGISGGGVFTADGDFAGIHWARQDETLHLHVLSTVTILTKLREWGFEVAKPPVEDSLSRYLQGVQQVLDQKKCPFKHYSEDFKYLLGKPGQKPELDAKGLCQIVAERTLHGALIRGVGGSGKSAYLGRIARSLIEEHSHEFIPFVVGASKIRDLEALEAFLNKPVNDQGPEELEAMLGGGAYAMPQTALSIADIRKASGGRGIFFLIDGLNELSLTKGEQVFFSAIMRHTCTDDRCIVTSRSRLKMTRQFWEVFDVADVGDLALDQVLGQKFNTSIAKLKQLGMDKVLEILRSPMFLQMSCDSGSLDFKKRADVLLKHFKDAADKGGIGIEDEQVLKSVGRAALEMYRKFKGTHFPISELEQVLPGAEEILAGALQVQMQGERNGIARFSHQLKHDFLVSYYLVKEESAWQRHDLDAATFRSENKDPLTLAVEQLTRGETPQIFEKNDRLLQAIYDWSLRAAIACLNAAGDDPDPASKVGRVFSLPLRTAILALIADKRDDRFRHTSTDSQKRADHFKSPHDTVFFDGSSVTRIVAQRPSTAGWFEVWRSIFCGDEELLRRSIVEIAGNNQVLAWTIANAVKKRPKLEDAGYLSRLLEELIPDPAKEIARWRIVHSLGSFPDAEYAAEAVFGRFDDEREYVWTRYGAGRSLMEMAALSCREQRRAGLLARLCNRVEVMIDAAATSSEDRSLILWEVGRSVLFRNVEKPQEWLKLTAPLVGLTTSLFQEKEEDRETWDAELLIPLCRGDWVGLSMPESLKAELSDQYGVCWPKTQLSNS